MKSQSGLFENWHRWQIVNSLKWINVGQEMVKLILYRRKLTIKIANTQAVFFIAVQAVWLIWIALAGGMGDVGLPTSELALLPPSLTIIRVLSYSNSQGSAHSFLSEFLVFSTSRVKNICPVLCSVCITHCWCLSYLSLSIFFIFQELWFWHEFLPASPLYYSLRVYVCFSLLMLDSW